MPITVFVVVPAFAMAVGTPALLWMKIVEGGRWTHCAPAMTLYAFGWIALVWLAARPSHSLRLWSLTSGVLLMTSVLPQPEFQLRFRARREATPSAPHYRMNPLGNFIHFKGSANMTTNPGSKKNPARAFVK